MADNNSIGISLIIKAVDQGSAILQKMSDALEKIGLSATSAGSKAGSAGQQIRVVFESIPEHLEKTSKSLKKIEDTLQGVGMALAGVGAAITAPMGLAVKTAADFENEMNKLQAFGEIDVKTDAGQKAFKALTDKARELGAATQFTAAEVASGMGELAKAGYSTEQIIASIGPALNLAFTEGRSMKDTAEDLVKVLASFGMSADQASRATDVLSKTSLATTTSMSGLVEGLKYVASLANNVGMNIEETTAYLGIFAQNGVDASMAGTGLRRLLGELSNPSKEASQALAVLGVEIAKNQDGSVNLTKTFEALKASGLTTANAFKIFGDIGGNVAITATKNIEAIKALTKENENSKGSLDKVVGIINQGLLPAWKAFTSALGEVAIQFAGPFLKGLKLALDAISSFLRGLSDLGKQFPILSAIVFGGIGAFGALATILGAVALAASGLSFAWSKVKEGFNLVLGSGRSVISMLREKTISINQETAALNANTGAHQKNAAARKVGTQGPGYTMGPTGAPMPVSPKTSPGAGAMALGVGAGLLEGQLNLTPTENAITKIGELTATTYQFGPVWGTIISGISSWVKILTKDIWDLLDVWDLWPPKPKTPKNTFMEQVDKTLKQAQLQIDEGKTFVNNVETAIGRAVSDFGGSITEYGEEWKKQFGEELPAAIIQGFHAAQQKLTGANFGFSNVFTEAAKGVVGLDDKLKIAKDTMDTMTKATETFYSSLNSIADIRLGNLKNEIESASASEKVAATEIARVESSAALERIQNARAQHAELKKLREDEHAAALSFIDAELVKAATDEKAKMDLTKKRGETEKAFRDKSLQDEQKLQDGIVTEIKKQQDAVASILKQRKELEQQIREEAVAAQRAQSDVWQKSIGEIERVKVNYALAVQNLQAANALLPTMPEKAMELAKKARDEFKGLAQDVNGLKNDLVNTFKTNQELLRDMAKKTMSPAQAWKSDLEYVNKLMNEAQTLMGQGKFKEAADAAAKAKGEAAKLDKVPEGTGLSQQEVSNKAIGLVAAAAGLEESAKKAGLEFAVQLNQGIQDNIGKANVTVKTAQDALLDANTKQLAIHANLLEILSRQFQTMIDQNNKTITAQGGEAVASQSATDMINAVKNSMGIQPNQPIGTGITNQTTGGTIPQYGGTVGGVIPQSPSSVQNSPEVARLLGQTDALLAKSKSESDIMAARMAELKKLELEAGAMDQMDRRGYGVSQARETSFSNKLKGLFGTDTFDFSAIQENIDSMLARAYQQAKGPVDQYNKALVSRGDLSTSLSQSETAGVTFEQKVVEASEKFLAGVEERMARLFQEKIGVDITVADNRAASASITRVG